MTESLKDAVMPLMPASPGALIKAGRERAGVHMAVLSVNLKVSVKQLEALEADQFELLSGPVFARALAAKVCRFVKIDPDPVLALMPAATNGLKPLQILGADTSPSYQSNPSASNPNSMGMGLKLGLLALLLILSILVFGTRWIVTSFNLDSLFETNEVVPTMPPVQEPVSTDAAQTDLPKAMVYDSATPSAVAPPVAASPSVATPTPGPTSTASPSSSNPPSETNK
ncbi:MAG: helix-turn-helix domain-containing protein [Pseudomonadota bacterium]|nr:helix-turn-helix domain-containing protein [Pseudomonadota bacterium]